MNKPEFGVMLRQEKTDFRSILDGALLCEELNYDSVWFYDHLLGMGSTDNDVFESWTLMSALSTVTKRVKLGTMVICNSFRQPSLLAKMASTLDHISGGRLDFAIGAGWFEPEYRAYGYPFLSTKERIDQLAEAVQIIRSMWTEDKTTFTGRYYTIIDATCNPKPIQKPHPPITVGGSGKKHLLRVVAEHADGWNCPASNAWEFDNLLLSLEAHAREFGRSVSDIEISEQTVCVIGKSRKELEDKLSKAKKRYGFFGDIENTGIVGLPDECIRRIKEKTSKGVRKFTIFFSDMMNPDTLSLFAKEVIPEFRPLAS
ncbi:MAG: TIGR03560 family F420-dependent LLM class oxidoreductase [Candidatus Caldarchaeum sp.]